VTERSAASWPDIVEGIGVLVLWLVILIRAVPALRQRNQRTMWVAVLCGAAAMSLRITPVYGLATRLIGLDLGANRDITADVIGVFAAAAIFAFVLNVVGRGEFSRVAYCIAVLVAVALLVINRYYDARTSTGLSQHSTAGTAYWLILLSYHLVANFWCDYICWRCSGRTSSPSLKAALLIFGVGTAMAGLLMVLSLIHFFTRINAIVYLFPLVQGAVAFLYGLGAGVPLVKPLVRAYRETVWLSRIYPLWRDLVNSVEGITLHTPRSYPSYLVLSRVGQSHGLYRRVIEVQDGILALYRYVLPEERLAATRFVQAQGVDPGDLDAAATARCIAAALRHKSEDRTLLPLDREEQARWDTSLFAEAAHLSKIARFYRSPLSREFTARLRTDHQPARARSHRSGSREKVRN
jgi:hypothetical protein